MRVKTSNDISAKLDDSVGKVSSGDFLLTHVLSEQSFLFLVCRRTRKNDEKRPDLRILVPFQSPSIAFYWLRVKATVEIQSEWILIAGNWPVLIRGVVHPCLYSSCALSEGFFVYGILSSAQPLQNPYVVFSVGMRWVSRGIRLQFS